MNTYTPDEYQRLWRKRAAMLKRAAATSSRDAALFMEATAKGMAPRKTGNLRERIKCVPIKDSEYEVSSSVPKSFPYHFWVNQTGEYRTIHPWWNKGNATVYGDGSHSITGTAQYFHLATLRTYGVFGKIVRSRVNNILSARVL